MLSMVAVKIAGGLLLAAAYPASGSIWIAIAVHFVTDFVNVLVFNVAGKGSLYRFEPPLTAEHRALFRVAEGAVTAAVLFAFYGVWFHLPGS